MVFLRLDDVLGQRRGGRLQLGLRGRARAAASPTACSSSRARVDHKEGETKLIAIEVDAVRGDARAARGAAASSTRARRAPGSSASSPRSCATSPARRRSSSTSRPRTGPRTLAARAGVPRAAGAGLLRRGEGAPRRGRGRLGPSFRNRASRDERCASGQQHGKRRSDAEHHGGVVSAPASARASP